MAGKLTAVREAGFRLVLCPEETALRYHQEQQTAGSQDKEGNGQETGLQVGGGVAGRTCPPHTADRWLRGDGLNDVQVVGVKTLEEMVRLAFPAGDAGTAGEAGGAGHHEGEETEEEEKVIEDEEEKPTAAALEEGGDHDDEDTEDEEEDEDGKEWLVSVVPRRIRMGRRASFDSKGMMYLTHLLCRGRETRC